MNKRTVTVPKGKDLVVVWATNHTYVVLYDASGQEYFRSQSKGKHLNITVVPGRYTLETDGKLRKVSLVTFESDLRVPKHEDLRKPPKM